MALRSGLKGRYMYSKDILQFTKVGKYVSVPRWAQWKEKEIRDYLNRISHEIK